MDISREKTVAQCNALCYIGRMMRISAFLIPFLLFLLLPTSPLFAECDCSNPSASHSDISVEESVVLRASLEFSVRDFFNSASPGEVHYALANERGDVLSIPLVIRFLDVSQTEWEVWASQGNTTQSLDYMYALDGMVLGTKGADDRLARDTRIEGCSVRFFAPEDGNPQGSGISMSLPIRASDLAALAKRYRNNLSNDFRKENEKWFSTPEYRLSEESFDEWFYDRDATLAKSNGEVVPRFPQEVWNLEELADVRESIEVPIWIPSRILEGGVEKVWTTTPVVEEKVVVDRLSHGTSGPNWARVPSVTEMYEWGIKTTGGDSVQVRQAIPDASSVNWGLLSTPGYGRKAFRISDDGDFIRNGCLEIFVESMIPFRSGCFEN